MSKLSIPRRMMSAEDFLHKSIDIIHADVDNRKLDMSAGEGAFGYYTVDSRWYEIDRTIGMMSYGEVLTIEGYISVINKAIERWRNEV